MERLSIQSIVFTNFKALVKTTLPLGPFTLIVGPNGSGKSTALQAIELLRAKGEGPNYYSKLLSVTHSGELAAQPELFVTWNGLPPGSHVSLRWQRSSGADFKLKVSATDLVSSFLSNIRVYALD